MVDILGNIWLTIDNFSYPKLYNIDNRDLDMLRKAKFNLIFYPSITFVICFGVSRNRQRLFTIIKKHFLNRDKNFKLELENFKMKNTPKEEITTQSATIQTEIQETIQYSSQRNISEIHIFQPRRVIDKRDPFKTEIVKDTKNTEPFSEEFGGWLKQYKRSMKQGFSPFKMKFKKRLDNKEELSVRINKFLYTTKLIYLPFLLMLIVCLKEFGITYFGLYCKYQPLIDRYFENEMAKNKINNKL
jgi:hypothetical protein